MSARLMISITVAFLLAGCTTRVVEFPVVVGGKPAVVRHTSHRFASKETVKSISIKYDGMDFDLTGYDSDLVAGVRAAVEEAVKVGAKAIKP